MTQAIASTYDTAKAYRKEVTYALIGVCVFMVGIYMFNVYRMISNTVAMEKIVTQTTELQSKVQALDGQYLQLSGKITPDTLKTRGFVQGKVSAYIPRNASLGSVARVAHEL